MFLKCRKSGISNCFKPYYIINLSIFLTFRHLETFHSYMFFCFQKQVDQKIHVFQAQDNLATSVSVPEWRTVIYFPFVSQQLLATRICIHAWFLHKTKQHVFKKTYQTKIYFYTPLLSSLTNNTLFIFMNIIPYTLTNVKITCQCKFSNSLFWLFL